MLSKSRGKIALISVHGDPAIDIGQEEAGGQNVYVKEIGEALARQGWQVDMFTRRTRANQAEIVQHSLNCRTIRLTAGPQKFIPRQKIFNFLPEFLQKFLDFQAEQQTIYPIVHTNYWLSAWVGIKLKKLQAVQHLHTYHSLGAVKYSSINAIPLIARTRLRVERQCLETADMIIATSPQEQEHMRSLVSEKGHIVVIPCGTNIDCFGSIDRDEGRAKLGIEQNAKLVMYAGRFDQRKGIETLVRAVAKPEVKRHEKLKLMIAGGYTPGEKDGIEKERITSIVKELGIEDITVFAGKVHHEDLAHYYAAADICVVPSHYEPFGLVAIEAMASRTPVVASEVGGLKFSVADKKTGILANPKNEADFAKAIDSILSNPDWREQLGKNARKRVERKFSWDGVAQQLDQEYLDQLSKLHEKLGLLVSAV